MRVKINIIPPSVKDIKYDLPAGIAVFFVAVPLCLGIAHASGAPLIAGLISGVIGGAITGFISNSQLAVSGPAAGLTAIALSGIAALGSFEAFLLATVLAGLIQIVLGIMKAGSIANYIPNTVIKGMLSAIGLILIIKQFPHLIGFDKEAMGVQEFSSTAQDLNSGSAEGQNTLTLFFDGLMNLNQGVLIIGLVSLVFLVIWDKLFQKKFKTIPGALLVVLIGVSINYLLEHYLFSSPLDAEHFVRIPAISSFTEFRHASTFPDLKAFSNFALYSTAFTIAIVASIETLLSVEAVDKLDPQKRSTPNNHELIAQGIGNTLTGLLGGLPMTAVIVRGSVNVSAGAQSKASTVIHGVLILLSVMFLASIMNMIPLASLAAVLIYTGYKLLAPELVVEQYKKGWGQLIPFVVTVLAIVFSDLLIGVCIGIVVSFIFIVMEDYKGSVLQVRDMGKRKRIILGENITFLHKPKFDRIFEELPNDSIVEIDGSRNFYIDKDIIELIKEFKQQAPTRNIELIIGGIKQMENHDLQESMRKSYERLFENNEKWINARTLEDPDYFKKQAKGQTPQYLFIGCSDSRVPANEITGTDSGELFVHRNIANMVVNTDLNMLSVVQYSVEVLNVKHIIVCGHYGCGGVKEAMTHRSNGLIDKWLHNIKDVIRLHKDELDGIHDEHKKYDRLIELNVREQVINLMKTSFIQKNRAQYGFPEVHGWVYDIGTGKINDLKIDVENVLPEYNDIYKIDVNEGRTA